MFIFSFKNFRFYFSCAMLAFVVAASVYTVSRNPVHTDATVLSHLCTEEEALCRSFLQSKGWCVSDCAPERGEVIIPERFNAVYSAYNALQKLQGFDLLPYCGNTVGKYVFLISGYPGAVPDDTVRATLLLFNGKIIGGDISSVRPDGFMHGFSFESTAYEFDPT